MRRKGGRVKAGKGGKGKRRETVASWLLGDGRPCLSAAIAMSVRLSVRQSVCYTRE